MSEIIRDELSDGFGRVIRNLRISITDRCNLRCVYCMPVEPIWLPSKDILSYEELHRLTKIFVELGVWKIRITGGEPTLRRSLPTFVEKIVKTDGVTNVGITTNGFFLRKLAQPLYDAGLRKLNVSLDTLDRERFRELTRRDALAEVLQGLAEAQRVGFPSIKINVVVMKGANDREILPMIELGRREGYEIRFIEFMPLDADDIWDRNKVYSQSEILRDIGEKYPFKPAESQDPHAPATRFRFDDTGAMFGIIGSVSQPFCSQCDRVRVTADGKFRTCLFAQHETDLKTPLRGGASDREIAAIIRGAVAGKEPGHLINNEAFKKPERTMHRIGG